MDILAEAIKYGIIDLQDVGSQLEMISRKRREILDKHPYKIWESKDGKWYTYVTDETKPANRRLIKKSSKEAIENYICQDFEKDNFVAETFDQAYWDWRKLHDRTTGSNTAVKYDTDYNRFFKGSYLSRMKLSKITRIEAEAFIFEQIKTQRLCKTAAKKLFEYFHMVMLYCLEKEWIARDPLQFTKMRQFEPRCYISERSKKEQVISEDDAKAILEKIREDHLTKPNYVPSYAVEFAMMTAMRVGEISALRWSDIKENSYILCLCSEKFDRKTNKYYIDDTKNRSERLIPLTDQMRKLLYLVELAEKRAGVYCEWIFADEGGRVHANVISSCIRNKCRQAKVMYHGIHACRKTINSNMRKAGTGLKMACDILGNTEEVNAKHYSFDVASVEEKEAALAQASMITFDFRL